MDPSQQLLDRGRRAAIDFDTYLRFVLDIQTEEHQRGWLAACQEIGDKPSGQKIIIVAPPGSGKSVYVGVGFTSWMIGRYPNEHFGLISFASEPAMERATAVRNIIEHEQPFRFTFPNVEPDFSSWSKSSFRVKRSRTGDPHPTLRATGALAAVVSYRLSGLVIDDPHDPKNSDTSRKREKVYKNYVDAISTRLIPNAWQLVITTRWADDDFAGQLIKLRYKGAPLWRVIHIPALDTRGRSYWPLNIPTEELKQKQHNMASMFAIQYMGDTTGGETQIIQRVGVYEDYEADDNGCPTPAFAKERDLMVGKGWDTALKDKQENDFSVSYTGGLDKSGVLWVLDRYKARGTIRDIVDNTIDDHKKWLLAGVWFEDSAAGTPATQLIMEEAPLVPCDTVFYGGGKRNRAVVLAQYIHSGQIRFPRWAEWFEDCKYNLTYFPHATHDDDVDALFVLADNMFKLRHPDTYSSRQRAVLQIR